ncbi:MAG TPA: hypothetical protein VM299_05585 [Solirubrobacteraceae bacterium]|jgi:hypothetical protein|nr:hypothetical protein [Solirubrobacteraceae bacterium]
MTTVPPQLRTLIEAAVADGVGMDDIEHELIAPANLPREDHDAVWLYALARIERPPRRAIEIIAG